MSIPLDASSIPDPGISTEAEGLVEAAEAPQSPLFLPLMNEFFELGGLLRLDLADTSAVVFDSGGFKVTFYPSPADGEMLCLDVSVMSLSFTQGDDDFQRLLALHQLNEMSRHSTGWIAVIDPEEQLLITKTLPLDCLSATDLQEIASDGLDRAQHLLGLWRDLSDHLVMKRDDAEVLRHAFEPFAKVTF